MRNIKYFFTFILLMIVVSGCVDSGDTAIDDTISGIYYLSGPRTTIEDPCIHCAPETSELREYMDISVVARQDPDDRERIQFYGIQGVDTGEFEKRVFPNCTRSADCEVFGKITSSNTFQTNGGAFEIDIENNGRRYQATGSLGTSTIDLKGQYTYEDITIDYDLNGKRVYLTLE